MKSFALICYAGCLFALVPRVGAGPAWSTQYDAALATAASDRKPVLINFTGSDWCGWCMKLKAEVFDTSDFAAFAGENLILLEIDFPRTKALSSEQRKQNQLLKNKYGVRGYPTIVVTDGTGKVVGQLGYQPGGPKAFIKRLKSISGFEWKDSGGAESVQDEAPAVAAREEPLWGGLVTPPKQYPDLKLTGLSGSTSRRLAIINNQTFAPGETAKVKLKDSQIKVLCKEIRAKSVLIQIEGSTETRELFLGQ